MKEKNMITAQRIKQCRLSINETLEQIGQLVGVHKTTVRRWETGETERIALPTIQKLAMHFNVSPAWLMGADVPMDRETDMNRNSSNMKIKQMLLSNHEQSIITAYRNKPEMQPAVDKLLGVNEDTKLIPSLVAARSKNNDEPIHFENLPDLSKFPVDDTEL